MASCKDNVFFKKKRKRLDGSTAKPVVDILDPFCQEEFRISFTGRSHGIESIDYIFHKCCSFVRALQLVFCP